MLLCKKEGPLSSKKYWLRIHITLRSPHCSVEDVERSYNNDFNLICRTRSFRFQCDSSNLKNSWIEDIRKSIVGEHEENQKETDRSRDALLNGDLTLTANKNGNKPREVKEEQEYESDTDTDSGQDEQVQKKKTNSTTNTDSSTPKRNKKRNDKVEVITENESFLINIPTTTTTFNAFGSSTQFDNSNPFAPQGQSNLFQPNSGNTTGGNPFQQNPSINYTSSGNPFLTMNSQQNFTGNSNPFQQNPSGSSGNPFLSNSQPNSGNTGYNPFAPQQPQQTSYNPFAPQGQPQNTQSSYNPFA